MKCVSFALRKNAITYDNAVILNRVVCMMYKGYLKTILDKGITDEETINKHLWSYLNDCELVVKALATDMKGYNNYREVIERSSKNEDKHKHLEVIPQGR